MASGRIYINVFYTLFILFPFNVEAISDAGGNSWAYSIDLPDSGLNQNEYSVPLDRTSRQTTITEKKNDVPAPEKVKITKKPTAMEIKPTSISVDGEQKQKAVINKKEYLSTKILPTTSAADQNHMTPSPVPSHENERDENFTHPSSTESLSLNSTWANASMKNSTEKMPAPPLNSTTVSDSEIQANKFLEADLNDMGLNETLKDHNITTQKVDHHLYYNTSIVTDPETFRHYWVDMDKIKEVKDILSNSYLRAVTLRLKFDFPFYGHLIRKIIIATGGFLYTGEYVHSWLSITQYIAPLMANFDTSAAKYSSIKYVDNGVSFTVQWENVIQQDKPEEGNFTFQCTLFKNGDIVFVYKHIPIVVNNLARMNNPIKVGISDAYIIDRNIFYVRKKTIYEYHRVNIEKKEIKNETVIIFNALNTCLDMKDCRSCVTEIPNFECNWCGNRCSNGMDRYRQEWIANGCSIKKRKSVDECYEEEVPISFASKASEEHVLEEESGANMGIPGIMGILFVICLAIGIGVWLFYAYRNPHTPAGQFLIRYRPSRWSWKRGEARYTAATIHM